MGASSKKEYGRRSFLRTAGCGASVLALRPLFANGAGEATTTNPANGEYEFDTPLDRLGTDSVRWDLPKRSEHMSRIVAGLGVADMDFRCAPSITAGLKRRTQHENWGYLDMGAQGPEAFVQGIIDWNKRRYRIDVINHDNLGISTGVHAGLVAALRALAPPRSKVLMVTPIYGGFYGDILFANVIAEESPMICIDGRYEIDWQDLERRMTAEVKTTILCNPHNPTGRAWTREELARYGELCLKHKIVVLSDEIHCDFVSSGATHTPFSTLDDRNVVANSVTFKSASKSFSLAGMKCAWFFSTNPDLFERTAANNRADLSTLGMVAARSAYEGGEAWLNECVKYIDANHEFTNRYIKANMPLVKVGRKPEATYLQWLDVSAIADRIGAQRLADAENRKPQPLGPVTGNPTVINSDDIVGRWFSQHAYVALVPGSVFGLGGINHLRMNIATSRQTLKAALDSMAGALKGLP